MVRPQASGSSTVGDWFESGRDTDCLNWRLSWPIPVPGRKSIRLHCHLPQYCNTGPSIFFTHFYNPEYTESGSQEERRGKISNLWLQFIEWAAFPVIQQSHGVRWDFWRTFSWCCTFITHTQWRGGPRLTQWVRCCATNRKDAASIPAGVSGFFIDTESFRSHYDPGVDSASNRNEYHPGGKGGRCVRLTAYHHPVQLSCNLGTLTSWNPLGHSGPVMGTALLFTHWRR